MARSDIGQGASFIHELSVYDVRCMGIFVTTLEKFENGGFTLKTLLRKLDPENQVIIVT